MFGWVWARGVVVPVQKRVSQGGSLYSEVECIMGNCHMGTLTCGQTNTHVCKHHLRVALLADGIKIGERMDSCMFASLWPLTLHRFTIWTGFGPRLMSYAASCSEL